MISVLGVTGGPSTPPGWALYSAASKKYADLAQPGGGWDAQALTYNQTPAIVSGDELATAAATVEGVYTITPSADGIVSVDTGSDTSRQSFAWDVYDYSLRAWYGGATAYIGNQAPSYLPAGTDVVLFLEKNQAITAQDLSQYWTDFEGDTVVVDNVDALFGTLDVTLNAATYELTGTTPNSNRIDSITFRGTDITGDYAEGDITLITGQVTVPNVVAEDQATGQEAILDAYLLYAIVEAYDPLVARGDIISQSPAAASLADPGSTVTLTVSLGVQPPARFTPSIAPRRMRRRPYLASMMHPARKSSLLVFFPDSSLSFLGA